MIITISGVPGSGKSTVARLVAKKLGFKHFSAGDFMRELAKERKLSLLELSRIAESDRSIDEELDDRSARIGSEKDDFVLDSRLGFHFIPNSFKVFLSVDEDEAARRIFGDVKKRNSRRVAEKENTDLDSTKENIRKRKHSETLRYRKYYGLNPFDTSQYDLVLDNTSLRPEEAADRIVVGAKKATF